MQLKSVFLWLLLINPFIDYNCTVTALTVFHDFHFFYLIIIIIIIFLIILSIQILMRPYLLHVKHFV